jgi:ketosteroid isomerase-like protein
MKTTTPIEALILDINDAFERGDVNAIADCCTDDVRWRWVGDEVVIGRDAVIASLKPMEDGPLPRMRVESLIIDGDRAACISTVTMGEGDTAREFAACDVYRFTGDDEPRICESTSFIIETAGERFGA